MTSTKLFVPACLVLVVAVCARGQDTTSNPGARREQVITEIGSRGFLKKARHCCDDSRLLSYPGVELAYRKIKKYHHNNLRGGQKATDSEEESRLDDHSVFGKLDESEDSNPPGSDESPAPPVRRGSERMSGTHSEEEMTGKSSPPPTFAPTFSPPDDKSYGFGVGQRIRLLKKLNVRSAAAVSSDRVGVLRAESVVRVKQIVSIPATDDKGKRRHVLRARIEAPFRGWLSLVSIDGQICAERVDRESKKPKQEDGEEGKMSEDHLNSDLDAQYSPGPDPTYPPSSSSRRKSEDMSSPASTRRSIPIGSMNEAQRIQEEIRRLSSRLEEIKLEQDEEDRLGLSRYPFAEGQDVFWLDTENFDTDGGVWLRAKVVRVRFDGTFDVHVSRESSPEDPTHTRIEDLLVGQPLNMLRLETKTEQREREMEEGGGGIGGPGGTAPGGLRAMRIEAGGGKLRLRRASSDRSGGDQVKKASFPDYHPKSQEMRQFLQDTFFDSKFMDKSSARMVTTIAGGMDYGDRDGFHKYAFFEYPSDVAVDPVRKCVYVVDSASNKIKKTTPDGEVTTLAGGSSAGYRDGKGARAKFFYPFGCFFDRLNDRLLVAERYNMLIRAIDVETQQVTTLAGTNGTYGWEDGVGTNSLFCQPTYLTADLTGNIYVTDHGNGLIRKITPSNTVSTVMGVNVRQLEEKRKWENLRSAHEIIKKEDYKHFYARIRNPMGIAVDDDGNIYVACRYFHQAVMKITPDHRVLDVAGDTFFNEKGDIDGLGSTTRFYEPTGLRFVGSLSSAEGWGEGWRKGPSGGRLIMADSLNNKIRAIDPRNGETRTLTGQGSRMVAMMDGIAMGPRGTERLYDANPHLMEMRKAYFFHPNGLDIDLSGNIYIADRGNHAIRKLNTYKEVEVDHLMDAVVYLERVPALPYSMMLDGYRADARKEAWDDELAVSYLHPITSLKGSRSVYWKDAPHSPNLSIRPLVKWVRPAAFGCVIVAFDPDHPAPARHQGKLAPHVSGRRGPFLHWMVIDSSGAAASGREIAEYLGPEEVAGRQGRHRIVFLLLRQRQHERVFEDFGGFDPRSPEKTRQHWSLGRFMKKNDLEPLALNFFYYYYNPDAVAAPVSKNIRKQTTGYSELSPGFLLKKVGLSLKKHGVYRKVGEDRRR